MKLSLVSGIGPHMKDMRRQLRRPQLHIISRPLPRVTGAAQQIGNNIRTTRIDLEMVQRQFKKSGLGVPEVQIDHDYYDVIVVRRTFAVGDELIIIDLMKLQSSIAL